ncbi:unnamed protein product [Moneuplotes crassus]|uniref:U3 small nucleolar RNA-associated protein 6 N-terminal domain-containing protein n=1 Tax=Euplotes crassus TaxID=5936 RepID=A0AAD1U7V8_EUPCR|nr:unnamed protein product [Moneuplotes crassus]
MTDKVDAIMEDMVPELTMYKNEDYFTEEEIRMIVKERRQSEIIMCMSPHASVADYLKAIIYEKNLNKEFISRRKEKTNKGMKMIDFSIHRRIIAIYERMTRRYRYDVNLLKDFLHYLLLTRSLGKFNSVMARTLHVHPNVLDFWLIAVYCEFDMRGNMQGSRKIFLQAMRRNPGVCEFYFEYIKYELRVLEKLHIRKKLLEQNDDMKIIEEREETPEEESKISESVPSIVYAKSGQAITTQFKYDVALHFRILELANGFSKVVDVSHLIDLIQSHIKNVLYAERRSEVLNYLIKDIDSFHEIEIEVTKFLANTTPDMESLEILITSLGKIDASSLEKFQLTDSFFKSIADSEELDATVLEQSAILFLEFISTLNITEEFNLTSTLESLTQKYPESFPILVHYCQNSLLKDSFENNLLDHHRDLLKKLNTAIQQKQKENLSQTKKYIIKSSELNSKHGHEQFSPLSFITKARFVILQYFAHISNTKILHKTLEFSVSETCAHLGSKEALSLIRRYIQELLLLAKPSVTSTPAKEAEMVSTKEVEDEVKLIVRIIKKFALKSVNELGKGKKELYDEILEKLQTYVDSNVFDMDAKDDIEGYLDDLK